MVKAKHVAIVSTFERNTRNTSRVVTEGDVEVVLPHTIARSRPAHAKHVKASKANACRIISATHKVTMTP